MASKVRLWVLLFPSLLVGQNYGVVLRGGRVIDPESGLDATRNVAIRGKKIAAISTSALKGKIDIDATGLVVAQRVVSAWAWGLRTHQRPAQTRFDIVGPRRICHR